MDHKPIKIGSLNIDQDSILVNRVVLLPEEASASIFMEKIFPLFSTYIVVSEDRAYPKNPDLNRIVFEKIKNDAGLAIVAFGFDSLKAIAPRSDKILVMDDLILDSSTVWKDSEPIRQIWDAHKIAATLRAYFQQWDKLDRIGSCSFRYKNYIGYDREKLGWVMNLLHKA